MFSAMLESLGAQTRLPARLIVIDDGSGTDDCQAVFEHWHTHLRPDALTADYVRQDNAGKATFAAATVLVTIGMMVAPYFFL